ncbi:MAG TPA: ferritin, partial [Bacteroidia bacterium]|nr:ferritin [Bacteroidia bacterium]
MLSPAVSKALNKQIELEGFSSQYYLSMASWAETQGLNGVSAFLYHHSDEERMHMLKLVKFVNERGGHGVVPALKQPPTTFKSVKSIFEEILKHEITVTRDINGLVDATLKEKD